MFFFFCLTAKFAPLLGSLPCFVEALICRVWFCSDYFYVTAWKYLKEKEIAYQCMKIFLFSIFVLFRWVLLLMFSFINIVPYTYTDCVLFLMIPLWKYFLFISLFGNVSFSSFRYFQLYVNSNESFAFSTCPCRFIYIIPILNVTCMCTNCLSMQRKSVCLFIDF